MNVEHIQEIQQNQEIRTEIVQDWESRENFAEDWDDLFRRAVGAPPYLSRVWVNTFVEAGRLRGKPLIIVARSGKKLVVLLPLCVRRSLGIKIAEPIGTGHPSYLGVLLDPEYPTALESLAEFFAHGNFVDVILNEDLSARDCVTNGLFGRLNGQNFLSFRVPRNSCHLIELSCSYEEYIGKRKSSKQQQKLRKLERRLLNSGEINFECYGNDNIPTEVFSRAANIQQQSWMKRRGATELRQPFYQKLLKAMAKEGFVRVGLVTIDGKDAAFGLSFVAHKRSYLSWIAFDLKYETLSVGNVMIPWLISDSCSHGFLSLDFGHGDAEYKRRFSTNIYNVERIVAGRGFRGHLIAICYFVVWRLAQIEWLHSLYRRMKTYCLASIRKCRCLTP